MNKETEEIGSGKPGPGRPKGSQNKITVAVKAAIAEAAETLGGTARLVAWAKESDANERMFWGTMYMKLLPHQTELTGQDGGPIQIAARDLSDEQLAAIASGSS